MFYRVINPSLNIYIWWIPYDDIETGLTVAI